MTRPYLANAHALETTCRTLVLQIYRSVIACSVPSEYRVQLLAAGGYPHYSLPLMTELNSCDEAGSRGLQ